MVAAGANSGLSAVGASSAYAAGATGAGIKVAVIDTNLDSTVAELQGQVTSDSIDIRASTRAANDIDPDGHGTLVASIIAAKKDGLVMHGVAFDAQILHIRADRPGSCLETGPEDECSFQDPTLAEAIRYAVTRGARIINLSLGGEIDADPTVENAIFAAAAAGVLVVISAGNEGAAPTATEAAMGTSPTEPAYVAGQNGSLGRVVAVGAVGFNRRISDFSNRAGATQNFYLLAPGQRVIAAGPDDNILLPNQPTCVGMATTMCNDADTNQDYYLVSGTSFSAPLVAGALALMLQRFPNITPENALAALLSTADDYVDSAPDAIRGEAAGVGADPVSGVGILNLARAFAPIGSTSFSFGPASVPLSAALAPASGALGDWAEQSGAFNGLVFQDVFERGFRIGEVELAEPRAPFADMSVRANYARASAHAIDFGPASLSWFSPPPEPYDPRTPWAEAPRPTFEAHMKFASTEIATGRGGGPGSLSPAMMLIDDPSGPPQLGRGGSWTSVSQRAGPVTLDFMASAATDRNASGMGVSFATGSGTTRVGYASLSDERTALGGALQSRFGGEDGTRMSAISVETARPVGAWTLSGSIEAAEARVANLDVSGLWTSAWSLNAERPFAGGALRLSLAQPRRAEGGSLFFDAPVEILKSGAIRREARVAGLSPSGREIDLETAWRRQLGPRTTIEAAAALSLSPNHVADAGPETALWFGVRRAW